jgi:hypothetical protein
VGDGFQGDPEVLAHRRVAPAGDVVSFTGSGQANDLLVTGVVLVLQDGSA